MAGIPAAPFEVFRDSKGNLVEHVRVGVRIDPNHSDRIFFLDLSNGLASERSGDLQAEISPSDLLAHYYNTVGISTPIEKAGHFFRKALSFSPDQYMVLSNYGNWLLETGGSTDEAMTVLLKASRSNPHFPFIWIGLEKAYTLKGDPKNARLAKQKAEALFQSRTPGR
jgi:tetratricopeptide (TPR) repeat protein